MLAPEVIPTSTGLYDTSSLDVLSKQVLNRAFSILRSRTYSKHDQCI